MTQELAAFLNLPKFLHRSFQLIPNPFYSFTSSRARGHAALRKKIHGPFGSGIILLVVITVFFAGQGFASPASSGENIASFSASVQANFNPAKESAGQGPGSLFAWERSATLFCVILLLFLISFYMLRARANQELFIRKISGLSAIDDAIGRSAEMGRGVLYIPGIWDMNEIQTVAGINILGQVAGKTAEMGVPLTCPVARPFVMSVAQEIVKQVYLEKGRPDAFQPDKISYVTYDQFGFVAGASGQIIREKPGACFYMGCFGGEALILSETGNSTGAIQIAGTAEINQIPFFVTSCDYTLIGEELFAASAYLTRNPKEVGCLKGQDVSKAIIITVIILGAVAATFSQVDFLADRNPLKILGKAFTGLIGLQ